MRKREVAPPEVFCGLGSGAPGAQGPARGGGQRVALAEGAPGGMKPRRRSITLRMLGMRKR